MHDGIFCCLPFEFEYSKEEMEKVNKDCYAITDKMLSDVPASMRKLIQEHNLEPIQHYGRGPIIRLKHQKSAHQGICLGALPNTTLLVSTF